MGLRNGKRERNVGMGYGKGTREWHRGQNVGMEQQWNTERDGGVRYGNGAREREWDVGTGHGKRTRLRHGIGIRERGPGTGPSWDMGTGRGRNRDTGTGRGIGARAPGLSRLTRFLGVAAGRAGPHSTHRPQQQPRGHSAGRDAPGQRRSAHARRPRPEVAAGWARKRTRQRQEVGGGGARKSLRGRPAP